VKVFGPFEEFCILGVIGHDRFEGEDNGGVSLLGVPVAALFQELQRSIIKLKEGVFLQLTAWK